LQKLQSLLGTLESDRQTALALKKEVVKELKNVEIAARTIERFNTPMASYTQNNQLPSKYVIYIIDYKYMSTNIEVNAGTFGISSTHSISAWSSTIKPFK